MEAALKRRCALLPAVVCSAILGLAPSSPTLAEDLPAKPAALLAALRTRIQAVDGRLDGVLGVYVRDLKTGHTIELRADEVSSRSLAFESS